MKKIIMTVLGVVLGYAAAYAADGSMGRNDQNSPPPVGESGFAFGVYFDEKVDNFLPYFQGFYKWFDAGIGANYNRKNNFTQSWNETSLSGNLGLRANVADKLYLTFGGAAAYNWTGKTGDKNDYIVGPYLGFQYFMSPRVMLNANIMVYDYERKPDNTRENEILQEGMIGVAYIF